MTMIGLDKIMRRCRMFIKNNQRFIKKKNKWNHHINHINMILR